MRLFVEIPLRLVRGYMWLAETIPVTAITVVPVGLVMSLMGMKVEVSSNSVLLTITSFLLIDGYFGHRNAEEKEQKMLSDFHRWHFNEMGRDKKDDE